MRYAKCIWATMIILAMLVGAAHVATGQELKAVGDVLAKGGRKLTKQEVLTLYSGATISGTQIGRPNILFKNTYAANGSISGDAWDKTSNWKTKMSGTWMVNDLAQMCADMNNSQQDKVKGCNYVWSLNGQYYSASSEDKSAPVAIRKVE